MSRTTIRELRYEKLDIPLHKPFGIAGGAQLVAANVLVTIVLEDGTIGIGEAAPLPAFNGETQSGALEVLASAKGAIEGRDARSWRSIAALMRPSAKRSGAAQCAIETAILDALTKRAGLSLVTFFGGAEEELVTDVTITIASLEEAEADTKRFAARGFTTFKIKVGAGRDEREDLARVTTVAHAAPGARLLLDGNGGMTAERAITLVRSLRKEGVEIALFEQPVARDDWSGLVRVTREAGVTVAADESVSTPEDALQCALERAAHVINVKLMKSGIADAIAIAEIARAAGIHLMIGGMVESRLAMSVSACFAAGLGGFRFVDLDTPLFLADDPFSGGYDADGPRLSVSGIDAGHGVSRRAS